VADVAAGAEREAPEPYARPDLYELLFARFDADLPFWLAAARGGPGEPPGPVLDLCCGTGRVLVPLLEAGLEVEGVDLYPGMLAIARSNAVARGHEPRLLAADMRSFETGRRYAAIVIPFNAFAHNLTTEDQLATLARCHAHLAPGGRLAFDVFSATPAMLAEPVAEPVLELEVEAPSGGGRLQLWDGRRLDVPAQIQHSRIEVRELAPDGSSAGIHRFDTRVRWVHRFELDLLLRLAGFACEGVWGGPDRGPVTAETAMLFALARRP